VANIGFVFAAMAVFLGLFVFLIGCCYTKCPKLSKICACIYNIKSILFFAVFLALGIVFIAVSSVGIKFV